MVIVMSGRTDRDRPHTFVATSAADGRDRATPIVLAAIYVVVSVFFGPLLFAGGGDLCDGPYGLFDSGTPGAQLTPEVRHVLIFQVAGATAMLTTGCFLLAYLWMRRHHLSRLALTLSSLGIVAMMIGFSVIFTVLAPGGQVCQLPN
ncbi:hypothetical protein AB0E01_27510 [Nocardia vinacea]|uniref:hypothetical protein n=1 Tax=Nocardia vinacea TaxID=96468 RepID=UPI0033D97A9C